jgi:hypothetical protein
MGDDGHNYRDDLLAIACGEGDTNCQPIYEVMDERTEDVHVTFGLFAFEVFATYLKFFFEV